MIEITGYDAFNGKRTSAKRFKRRFVANTTELENEREKIRKRKQRTSNEPIEIYLNYRQYDDCCE